MSATRLEGLHLEEVSGVDEPANEIPGWLVVKSAHNLEEIHAEIAEVHEDLGIALEDAALYLGDAPENVLAAHGTLKKWVGRLLGGSEEPAEADTLMKERKQTEMTHDELNAILDERDAGLLREFTDKVGEIVKSLEPEEPTEETTSYVSAEDFEALKGELAEERENHEATREALLKAFDRLENIEKRFVTSNSLPGQEDEETGKVEKSKSSGVAGALSQAAKGEIVTIAG